MTGATRGIGLAIVQRLAAEGADVGLCARDAAGVQRAADGVRAVGRRAHGVALDVTTPGAAAAFVEECRAALGRVDAVVASAGGAVGPPAFAATSDDDWEATYRWNVVHPAALIRAARPALAVRGRRRGAGRLDLRRTPEPLAPVRRGQGGAGVGHALAGRRARARPHPRQLRAARVDPLPGRRLGALRRRRSPRPTPTSSTATCRGARSAARSRSPTSSPSCSRRAPAGSTARSSRSTAPSGARPRSPPPIRTPPRRTSRDQGHRHRLPPGRLLDGRLHRVLERRARADLRPHAGPARLRRVGGRPHDAGRPRGRRLRRAVVGRRGVVRGHARDARAGRGVGRRRELRHARRHRSG